MATPYVRRFIIVVRADLAAQANLAAKHASWDQDGGERTFDVPLSASSSLPAQAYWCNTSATAGIASAIATRLKARGATDQEVTPVTAGGTPASNRFAVLDAQDWTPEQVLAKLGLQRIGGTP